MTPQEAAEAVALMLRFRPLVPSCPDGSPAAAARWLAEAAADRENFHLQHGPGRLFAAGVCASWLDPRHKEASQAVWIGPGLDFGAYEAWAREQGCAQTRLHVRASVDGTSLRRLLSRRGYEPAETHFTKRL